jgi:hypothetical protein
VLAAVFVLVFAAAVFEAALAGFAFAFDVLAAPPQAEKRAAVAATHRVKIKLILIFGLNCPFLFIYNPPKEAK